MIKVIITYESVRAIAVPLINLLRPRAKIMTETRSDPEFWFWAAIAVAGLLILLGGFTVIGWSPLEFRAAWYSLGGSEPRFVWLGVQKIALAILDGPLSGVTMACGVIIFWIGVGILLALSPSK
jgi:hypothetical protein